MKQNLPLLIFIALHCGFVLAEWGNHQMKSDGSVVHPEFEHPAFGYILDNLSESSESEVISDSIVKNGQQIVVGKAARFTILTERTFRIEWSPSEVFEDHSTSAFLTRNTVDPVSFGVRNFTKSLPNVGNIEHWVEIATKYVTIQHKIGAHIRNPGSLNVEFVMNEEEKSTWHPGLKNTANLKGTVWSLDAQSLSRNLHNVLGVCSRDGWAIIDDSNTGIYDRNFTGGEMEINGSPWPAGWFKSRPTRPGYTDLYYFFHGLDYKGAVKDYVQLSGKPLIPPRVVFGIWHSEWFPYHQEEVLEVVDGFKEAGVPVDIMVVDNDWHTTKDSGPSHGEDYGGSWGGYSWDERLFPNHEHLSMELYAKSAKLMLNTHPQIGIRSHEQKFNEFCSAMGIEPKGFLGLSFLIHNLQWSRAYTTVILPNIASDGIWIDYQHKEEPLEGVSPTLWLSHVVTTMSHWGGRRPLVLNRFGGYGSQRYGIVGHTGDVMATWKDLQTQALFLTRAANVAFGMWSHDLGGFWNKDKNTDYNEMFTRWMQFGIFSPIVRPHGATWAGAERKFYKFPYETARTVKEALLLRKTLTPYIYSAMHLFHTEGLSLVHPLYYDFPQYEQAYDYSVAGEYLFGEHMVVFPVIQPIGDTGPSQSRCARTRIWVPPGQWVHLKWGMVFEGPAEVTLCNTMQDVPALVRADAVIPRSLGDSVEQIPRQLQLHAYTGLLSAEPTSSVLYEDDGKSLDYLTDAEASSRIQMKMTSHLEEGKVVLDIERPSTILPESVVSNEREYDVFLHGLLPVSSILVNDKNIPAKSEVIDSEYVHIEEGLVVSPYFYDLESFSTVINITVNWKKTSLKSLMITVQLYENDGYGVPSTPIPALLNRMFMIKSEFNGFQPPLHRSDWPHHLQRLLNLKSHLKMYMASMDNEKITHVLKNLEQNVLNARLELLPFVADKLVLKPYLVAFELLSFVCDCDESALRRAAESKKMWRSSDRLGFFFLVDKSVWGEWSPVMKYRSQEIQRGLYTFEVEAHDNEEEIRLKDTADQHRFDAAQNGHVMEVLLGKWEKQQNVEPARSVGAFSTVWNDVKVASRTKPAALTPEDVPIQSLATYLLHEILEQCME